MQNQEDELNDQQYEQALTVPWKAGQSLRTRMNAAYQLGIEQAYKNMLKIVEEEKASKITIEDNFSIIPMHDDGWMNLEQARWHHWRR